MQARLLEIKWGVIFIIMMLLWMVLERAIGLHSEHIDKHATYTNLVALPSIIIYILALRQKRNKDYGGEITYMQSVISGLIISLVVALATPLTQYLVVNVITPDYFANVSAFAVEQGQMTEAEAAEYFSYQNYVKLAAIGALVMGLLTTVIVSLFVKKSQKV